MASAPDTRWLCFAQRRARADKQGANTGVASLHGFHDRRPAGVEAGGRDGHRKALFTQSRAIQSAPRRQSPNGQRTCDENATSAPYFVINANAMCHAQCHQFLEFYLPRHRRRCRLQEGRRRVRMPRPNSPNKYAPSYGSSPIQSLYVRRLITARLVP